MKSKQKLQPRREHLLNTAYNLFNANGYHATGIDTIMSVSGVSKTTLYKYFRTKEELILEVLKRRHQQFEQMIADNIKHIQLNNPMPAISLMSFQYLMP